ncbi:MAG TPA: hypothetical protein VGO52_06835 [Hyphomonadaceae bacterium]|jgi:hypothetical protein|nr:hypothetical protein [Hyphomonadaceae bacterium]
MRRALCSVLAMILAAPAMAQALDDSAKGLFHAVCAAPEVTGEFSWSPDSKRLAFAVKSPSRNLRILTIEGMTVSRLDIGDMYGKPIWSPKDERIAVLAKAAQPGSPLQDLYIVSAKAGAPARKIAAGLSYRSDPAWSPDGATLLAATPDGAIVLIDPDTGGVTRLMDGLPGDDDSSRHFQPFWVDAAHFAFAVEDAIYLFDIAQRTQTRLPLPSSVMLSLRPGAPDEYWYVDRQKDGSVLTVMRKGEPKVVSTFFGLKFDGPNAFGQVLTSGVTETYLIDTNRGVISPLWPDPPEDVRYRNEYGAIWSPDHRRFAFNRIEGGGRRKQTDQVCIGLPNASH